MKAKKFDDLVDDFYEKCHKRDSVLVLLYMVLSLGLFSIFWIFSINKRFEEVGFDRPNPSWGIFVMFVLPIGWIINMLLFKVLSESSEISRLIDITGWVVIMLLILQYMFDFCKLFGRVTKSNHLIWYYAIYSGFLGVFLFLLEIYAACMLVFFTLIAIPAMQEKLNSMWDKENAGKKNTMYYSYGKRYS